MLDDGTRGIVWPVLPTDRAGLAEGYRHLDVESRYRRFLTSAPRLSEAMLDHLVDEVDGVDHVALVLIAFVMVLNLAARAVARWKAPKTDR